ncbi:MAG: DUF3467 domain-containing protein [Methanoregulaceae archaeon]|nr:DUF3467 domain-containing protein [Methanoregulaceae archaeon]
MGRPRKTAVAAREAMERKDSSISLDPGLVYQFSHEDLSPEITHSAYSNAVYVNRTDRDVFLDFLEMPGIRREDGKVRVKGTRVYLSFAAAESLGKVLGDLMPATGAAREEEVPRQPRKYKRSESAKQETEAVATLPKKRGRRKKVVA